MWWESDLWWCVKQSSWPRFVTVRLSFHQVPDYLDSEEQQDNHFGFLKSVLHKTPTQLSFTDEVQLICMHNNIMHCACFCPFKPCSILYLMLLMYRPVYISINNFLLIGHHIWPGWASEFVSAGC